MYLVIISFALSSCFGIKTGNKSPAGKYFEAFYLGDGKNQYFIKPLELENDDYEFVIDFTFRDFEFKEKGSSINFTIESEELISKVDSIAFESNGEKHAVTNINRMFFEKKSDDYIIRSNAELSAQQVEFFFSSSQLFIVAYSNDKEIRFKSSSGLEKTRKNIYADLIELIKHY